MSPDLDAQPVKTDAAAIIQIVLHEAPRALVALPRRERGFQSTGTAGVFL